MLAVSLIAAVLVLCFYSFFSFRKIESQAVEFVTNHVEALVQAGVNSQNVNEIDKEISRFIQTWKESQDLELRVDIFLGEKMIAHGGQLQPFRYFFSKSGRTIRLSSGDELKIEIEIGLQKFLLSALYLLAFFVAFILGIFYVLMASMRKSIKAITSPLEARIEWLKSTAQDLPNSAKMITPIEKNSNIREIDELSSSISTLLTQIGLLEGRLSKTSFNRGRIKMAEQVAHSIKGTIGTLQLKLASAKSLSVIEKREMSDCINSLRDISVGLLESDRNRMPQEIETMDLKTPLHVLTVMNSVLAAKWTQSIASGKNINFIHENEDLSYTSFCLLKSGDLETVLSNLIDNSIEAISDAGTIRVRCLRNGKNLDFFVSDTGRGISAHLVPLLMQDGATFGKSSGNGIGLSHIKEILESNGGRISISSVEDKGTTVHFSIPSAAPLKGFAERIDFPIGATVVIVDDESLVAEAWKLRLSSAVGLKIESVVHLSSSSKFRDWFQENGHGEFGQRIYLFDYDLKDGETTGITLIEEHGLNFESVLVSGLADTEEVRRHCNRIGVMWLSKEFLRIVPLFSSGGIAEEASLLGAVLTPTNGKGVLYARNCN